MSDHHTYKKVEIIGSSKNGIDDAIKNAISECSKSVKNMEWFEVESVRGHLDGTSIGHYQVTIKVGFRIEAS